MKPATHSETHSFCTNVSNAFRTCCVFSVISLSSVAGSVSADVSAGDKLQVLTNLHPDFNKSLLYTMNYQQPGLIPACDSVEVLQVKKKKMVFLWQGREMTMVYEKHTKKAGVSFQESLSDYFGPSCDKAKLKGLSKIDRQGIKEGRAKVGMTKAGVLFAMGRPPHHANPVLDSQQWMYWLNRFKRQAIEFDDKGIVSRVRL